MPTAPLSRHVLAATLLTAAPLSPLARAQSVVIIPAEIPQNAFGIMHLSGDGSTVLGNRTIPDPVQPTWQPWMWSASRGVLEPALPTGAISGIFTSWTAAGDRAVLRTYTGQSGNSSYGPTLLVDAAGATQPFTSPLAGYTAGSLSGDGRTVLLGQAAPSAPGQGITFATSGPTGTRVVGFNDSTWNNLGYSTSFDGSVVVGLTSPVGGNAFGQPHLLRWSGGPTAGGPSATFASPPDYFLGVIGGVSGDGSTIFGGLNDSSFVLHPTLFTESNGYEFLPTPSGDGTVASVSFDASSALLTAYSLDQSYLWRRGLGSTPIADVFASHHINLTGLSDLRVYEMSYDAQTFLASALHNGTYVPLLITIPAPLPASASLMLIGAACSRRTRRTQAVLAQQRKPLTPLSFSLKG